MTTSLPADPAGMVRVGQSGGYFVKSETTRGAWWFVWGTECSCPATVARCKHVRMVDAFCRALDETHRRPVAPPAVNLLVD